MAFTDRYGITRFTNENYKISFSIDENCFMANVREVVPVLLIVPNINQSEHDHIVFSEKQLRTFHSLLALKGTRFLNLDRNRFEIDTNYKLSLYELYDGNLTLLSSIQLNLEIIHGLRDWIDEFLTRTQSQLVKKYQDDLVRK